MPRRARMNAPGMLQHVIMRGIDKRQIVYDVTDLKDIEMRLELWR